MKCATESARKLKPHAWERRIGCRECPGWRESPGRAKGVESANGGAREDPQSSGLIQAATRSDTRPGKIEAVVETFSILHRFLSYPARTTSTTFPLLRPRGVRASPGTCQGSGDSDSRMGFGPVPGSVVLGRRRTSFMRAGLAGQGGTYV